jgi:phenylpropionate dioxygenase-like ring-hydroxylating dioxygenase large terminal subunit
MRESLPWIWYVEPEVLQQEQDRIFRRTWQYVGHMERVSEPGSYFAGRAGAVPVVVTRDREGELHALLNVCRHRGSVVARGEGRRTTLQCPYHAWTYELDGALHAAPRSERVPGFRPEELCLVPLALEAWGPFLFVNPEREAPPLAETLGDVPRLLADGGVDVDSLRFHARTEYELEANWKIACENYLECYHCAVAHPAFSAVVDVSPDAYHLEASGATASQFARTRDGDGRGQFHFVWPNLKINVFPGAANLSIGPVLPAGPERSVGFLDYFFGRDVANGWIEELLGFDDQVGREDAALVASVQEGVRSGLVERGRLMGESEVLIEHFQRLVADALA